MVRTPSPKVPEPTVRGFDDALSKALGLKIATSASVADRLAYSIDRAVTAGIAPLTMQRLEQLTYADMELMDAYLYRYGSLVSNIQDSIFKSIGELEQEPVSSMSNRDKANLMERIGALPSAETFASFVVIRNKLMHDYPDEARKQLERINFISEEAPHLVQIFLGLAKYCEKFGVSLPFENCEYLVKYSSEVCEKCHHAPCVCVAELESHGVAPTG